MADGDEQQAVRRTREVEIQTIDIPYNPSTTSLPSKKDKSTLSKPAILKKVPTHITKTIQKTVLPFSFLILLAAVVVASNIALPLLVVSILIVRLLQFFAQDVYYVIAAFYKRVLLSYMCVALGLILLEMGLIYPLAKYVPSMKKVIIIGLPITKLIKISCALCGFYILNYIICLMSWKYFAAHGVSMEQYGSISEIHDTISEGVSCVFLWWVELVVKTFVPSYEGAKITRGLETHALIEVLIFIAIGYNVIRVSTYATVWVLWKFSSTSQVTDDSDEGTAENIFSNTRKYLVFCAFGLRRSFNFLFSSAMLALTWELYFRAHIPEDEAKRIMDFGAWTGFSLFVCSVLWLIKNGILLSWEAREVYLRFESDILNMGVELYFLGILGCDKHDIFRLWNRRGRKKVNTLRECFLANKEQWFLARSLMDKESDSRRSYSLYELHQVAQYFLKSKDALSKDIYIVDLLEHVKTNLGSGEIDDKRLKEFIDEMLKNGPTRRGRKNTSEESPDDHKTEMNDWTIFKNLVIKNRTSQQSKDQITLDDIQAWAEKARKNCLFLANTLSSAIEVVECLNNILSAILLAITLLLWLILTKLATIKVLSVILAQQVAFTFIYKDTLIRIFEGIMFMYAIRPFNVGDLCHIDDMMLEVKAIDIWKTTFLKVENEAEVIYQNPQLNQTKIINYKGEFDRCDCLVFDASSLGEEKIKELEAEIKQLLEKSCKDCNPTESSVAVLGKGDKVNVVVRLKYNFQCQDSTPSAHLKRKEGLQSQFSLYIHNLIKRHAQNQTPGCGTETSMETPK